MKTSDGTPADYYVVKYWPLLLGGSVDMENCFSLPVKPSSGFLSSRPASSTSCLETSNAAPNAKPSQNSALHRKGVLEIKCAQHQRPV